MPLSLAPVLTALDELLNGFLTLLPSGPRPFQVCFVSLVTTDHGVRMISVERTVEFVWRCPDCAGMYGGEGLLFLYTDGTYRYCPCGGRLVEGVEESGVDLHYRLVIPEYLRGTELHRQLARRMIGEDAEVEVGGGRTGVSCRPN